jgi:hypothetical protein
MTETRRFRGWIVLIANLERERVCRYEKDRNSLVARKALGAMLGKISQFMPGRRPKRSQQPSAMFRSISSTEPTMHR